MRMTRNQKILRIFFIICVGHTPAFDFRCERILDFSVNGLLVWVFVVRLPSRVGSSAGQTSAIMKSNKIVLAFIECNLRRNAASGLHAMP